MLDDLVNKARKFALEENWGHEAIEVNEKILKLNGNDVASYTRLAKCFKEQNNLVKAKEMYVKAISLDPENRVANNNLPVILTELKNLEIVNIAKTPHEAYNLGLDANKQRNYKLALRSFSLAYSMDPQEKYGISLAASLRKNKQLDKAEELYRTLMARNHNNNAILTGLAAVLRDIKRFHESIILYRKVLSRNTNDCFALNGYGAVCMDFYSQAGNPVILDHALKAFERVAELGGTVENSESRLETLRFAYQNLEIADGLQRVERLQKFLGLC